MKFAIIIPTYNRPDHVVNAINSVLAQDYDDLIVVVSNDASQKDYKPVKAQYTDPRVVFIDRSINGGCNAARNTGIDYACNHGIDYLVFLDDEETLNPGCLTAAVQMIKQHPDIGWFVSNTSGETKKCTRRIVRDQELDWINDYVYGKTLRGDKTHVVSTKHLGSIRFDGLYRASNMWPFFMRLCIKTKLFAYTFDSKKIQYLETGITKTNTRYPKTLHEVYSRFARHWFVIKHRPQTLKAYKYLLLELLKTPKRLIILAHKNRAS